MPRYRCMLSQPAESTVKDAVADVLADVEENVFGTDPADVLVEFTDIDRGRWYTAAELSRATLVTGTVPDGTTQEQRALLMDEIGRRVAAALDQDFNDVMVVASDGRRGR